MGDLMKPPTQVLGSIVISPTNGPEGLPVLRVSSIKLLTLIYSQQFVSKKYSTINSVVCPAVSRECRRTILIAPSRNQMLFRKTITLRSSNLYNKGNGASSRQKSLRHLMCNRGAKVNGMLSNKPLKVTLKIIGGIRSLTIRLVLYTPCQCVLVTPL